jgi:hypothetical protein
VELSRLTESPLARSGANDHTHITACFGGMWRSLTYVGERGEGLVLVEEGRRRAPAPGSWPAFSP